MVVTEDGIGHRKLRTAAYVDSPSEKARVVGKVGVVENINFGAFNEHRAASGILGCRGLLVIGEGGVAYGCVLLDDKSTAMLFGSKPFKFGVTDRVDSICFNHLSAGECLVVDILSANGGCGENRQGRNGGCDQ